MNLIREIVYDIDGVLLDMINPLLRFHNDRYGTKLKFEDVTSHSLWRIWGGTPEDDFRKLLEFFETKYASQVFPVNGAVYSVNQLERNLNNGIIVSSRPNEIEKETKESIDTYFPQLSSRVHLTNQFSLNGDSVKKSKICLEHGASVIVEDSIENAKDCAEHGIQVLLMDYPWNQSPDIPGVTRVKDWAEVLAHLF